MEVKEEAGICMEFLEGEPCRTGFGARVVEESVLISVGGRRQWLIRQGF